MFRALFVTQTSCILERRDEDDPDYLCASGSTLGGNLYAYCENDAVNRFDPSGMWVDYYAGFKMTRDGFDVNVTVSFLSRNFCLSFAKDAINLHGAGPWFYKTIRWMDSTRIAQELWFHALVYYVGGGMKTILLKLGISWSWLEEKMRQARYIEVNYNDSRAWVYSYIWYSGSIVKSLIGTIYRGYWFYYYIL